MTSAVIALALALVASIALDGMLAWLLRGAFKDAQENNSKAAEADARLMIQRTNTDRLSESVDLLKTELKETHRRYRQAIDQLQGEPIEKIVADPPVVSDELFWLFEKARDDHQDNPRSGAEVPVEVATGEAATSDGLGTGNSSDGSSRSEGS